MLKKLELYIKNTSKLIVEVPSSTGVQSPINEMLASGAYYIPPGKHFTLMTEQGISNEIKVLCANIIPVLREGFQLLRSKATEILAFILSNIDRQFSPCLPLHMPIAYALKGPSLSIETLRIMLQEVRLKCKETKTRILCECFDGQWAMMIYKSKEGKPLTRIQVMKTLWNTIKKKSKKELFDLLDSKSITTKAHLDIIQNWASHNLHHAVTEGNLVLERLDSGLAISNTQGLGKVYTSTSPQIWNTPDMRKKKERLNVKKQIAKSQQFLQITYKSCNKYLQVNSVAMLIFINTCWKNFKPSVQGISGWMLHQKT